MKVIMLEGTPAEIKEVASLFMESPAQTAAEPASVTSSDQPSIDPVEAIKKMLTRLPISDGQRAVYKALANGKLEYSEYLKSTGRSAQQMAGVHGALGGRINNTQEIHQAGLPGDIYAVLNYEEQGDKGYFSLTPHALEALKEEGIV